MNCDVRMETLQYGRPLPFRVDCDIINNKKQRHTLSMFSYSLLPDTTKYLPQNIDIPI